MTNLDENLQQIDKAKTKPAPQLNADEVAAILDVINESNVIGNGKTKTIYQVPGKENLVVLDSKDEITAGDGARKDAMIGKAALSNQTTSIVFDYLNDQGIATHFHQQLSPTAFLGEKCDMIPLEVIYRYAATGSYLKRNQEVKEGEVFETPVYELCYKRDVIDTEGNKVSDPFMELDANGNPVMLANNKLSLIHPKTGANFSYDAVLHSLLDEVKPLNEAEIIKDNEMIISYASEIKLLTSKTFDQIQKLYGAENLYLVDGKIEFGVDIKGGLRLADVFDADSARVWVSPEHKTEDDKKYIVKGDTLDKQGYREGESTNDTIRKYERLLSHLQKAKELANRSQSV